MNTTDLRNIYHQEHISHAHCDKHFQLCLSICCEGRHHLLHHNKKLSSSQPWHSTCEKQSLSSSRMNFMTKIEFYLFAWMDPRQVESNENLRTYVTELAYFIEQKVYRCAESRDQYLLLKSRIQHHLKDIICGSALKLLRLKKNISLHIFDESFRGVDIAQEVELYLRSTANEPLPGQRFRWRFLSFTLVQGQRQKLNLTSSSAGAA